ncbi:hypothetical protein B0192_09775, partial [Leptospira interrogans serovar Australis]
RFFFEEEDVIRVVERSRGLGDVYKSLGEALTIFFNALSGEVPLNFYSPQRIKRPLKFYRGKFAGILFEIVEILQKHLSK